MKSLQLTVLITFILLTATACDTEDPVCCINPSLVDPTAECGNAAVIDDNLFQTAPDDALDIQDVRLEGNCLTITFAASGCDGATWEEALIGDTSILESLPVQRGLRLSINNNEECDAVPSKTASFSLVPAVVEGETSVLINLQGWNQQILYEY